MIRSCRNKIISNEKITQFNSQLYLDVKNFVGENICIGNQYIQIEKLLNELVLIKKTLKKMFKLNNSDEFSQLDLNKFATSLYKYFYLNLDKFIHLQNYDVMTEHLYLFVMSKYNLIKLINFKLDYLQNYFTNKINLSLDLTMNFQKNQSRNYIQIFESETKIIKIINNKSMYTNSYYPKYRIEILDKSNLSKIKTIGFADFDSDRNLESFIIIMLEFITNTIEIIENFK